MNKPEKKVNAHHKTWQDKLAQWWHTLPKNTKISYTVIALVVVGAGTLGARAYNDQLVAQRHKALSDLLMQYGYTNSNSSLCDEGNDVVYKDENGEEQKIYGDVTGSIFDDIDAIKKKLRDAKYTDFCDSLRDEYVRAANTYDIDKVKEILAKVSAAKKEALKRKHAEVEIARGQKAESNKERETRTNTFTVTTRDGYSYQVTYELPKEPAVYASIDTTEGKPGYVKVSVEMSANSWSVKNTTSGKKAPCFGGLLLQPLYSTALGDVLKQADEGSKVARASLSDTPNTAYTAINDGFGFRGIFLNTPETYYDNCSMAPNETVTSKSSVRSEATSMVMREDVAKQFVELAKQPTGYIVSFFTNTYRQLDNATPVYGEVYDRPIVNVAKGFKR